MMVGFDDDDDDEDDIPEGREHRIHCSVLTNKSCTSRFVIGIRCCYQIVQRRFVSRGGTRRTRTRWRIRGCFDVGHRLIKALLRSPVLLCFARPRWIRCTEACLNSRLM